MCMRASPRSGGGAMRETDLGYEDVGLTTLSAQYHCKYCVSSVKTHSFDEGVLLRPALTQVCDCVSSMMGARPSAPPVPEKGVLIAFFSFEVFCVGTKPTAVFPLVETCFAPCTPSFAWW